MKNKRITSSRKNIRSLIRQGISENHKWHFFLEKKEKKEKKRIKNKRIFVLIFFFVGTKDFITATICIEKNQQSTLPSISTINISIFIHIIFHYSHIYIISIIIIHTLHPYHTYHFPYLIHLTLHFFFKENILLYMNLQDNI
jgi:hypothetical protein